MRRSAPVASVTATVAPAAVAPATVAPAATAAQSAAITIQQQYPNHEERNTMTKKNLREFLSMLEGQGVVLEADVNGTGGRQVEYISYNSMDVKEGTVFICKGLNFKKEYLEDAIEKGAFCYVAEKKIKSDFPYILVSDMRRAMSDLGAFFYDEIWNEKLQMIGITGTKGKSTTATFVKAIMDDYCKSLGEKEIGFVSGIYTYDGEHKVKAKKMTTPETLQLHKLLADCARNGCKYLVMETSSQALKYDRTKALKYKVGGFLNISEDHISDREHPDIEDYFSSKLKIFEQCEIGCINLQIDKQYLNRIIKASKENCEKTVTFGRRKEADYYGFDINSTLSHLNFKVLHEGITEYIEVSIGGSYNADNALAAIAITHVMGIPFENIKSGLAKVKVSGRMELYKLPWKNVEIVVDYAHNKLSYETLLKNIKTLYPDKKILLIAGCVGGKAQHRRKELAEVINRYVDQAILTEQYSGEESVEDICNQINKYVSSDKSVKIITDRGEAVTFACKQAEDGWLIIAAGSDEDRDRISSFIEKNDNTEATMPEVIR